MRRNVGTLTYRRNRRKSRKAPVVREGHSSRHRQLFLVFLFVVSQFFFLQSSMFVVNEVTVNGQSVVDEATILKAMGIEEQARYWELSPEGLQTGILALNGMESAKVDVVFPGRVSVNVAERKPIFTVASRGSSSKLFSVDKDGVVVGEGAAPDNALRVLLDRPVRVGGFLSANELEVCAYLKTHLTKGTRDRLESVRFDDNGDVTLRVAYLNGKIPVQLGRPEKLSYKLFLLEELISSLKQESAEVVSIDLRFSTPIVRQPVQLQKAADSEAPPAE